MNERQLLAMHESAHAVAAVVEGVEVGLVSLDPPECRTRPAAGWVAMAEDEHKYLPADSRDPAIARHARIFMAGALVDARFGEVPVDGDDLMHISRLIDWLDLHVDKFINCEELYFERLRDQTIRLIAENGEAIHAVAAELLRCGQLTGAAVRRIVALAHRWPT